MTRIATTSAPILPSAEIASYREYPVGPPLRPHSLCVWTQTVGPGDLPCTLRVLPDGCTDIIWIDDAPPLVAGPATRFHDVLLPPGSRILGVRFHPGAAEAMLGVPAPELRDRSVQLADLWGAAADHLTDRMQSLPSSAARLRLAAAFLRDRDVPVGAAQPAIRAAVTLMAGDLTATASSVACAVGLSERQLHRYFTRAVGYGPKRFQRIVRFQRLLAHARRAPVSVPLAELALELGYADQSHMTRDVRELSGTVPTGLLGRLDSTLILSELFKTPTPPTG